MHAYRTILIDPEGTLIDSNDAHASAWTRALRNAGYAIAFSEVRERIGMTSDQLLNELCGIPPGSGLARGIAADHAHLFESIHLSLLRVLPGARDLLARIKHEGLTLVLATWSTREATLELLEHAQLLTAFDDIVTAEDSRSGGDLLLLGLSRVLSSPAEGLLIGDTPYDIARARAAGVTAIALRSGGWPDQALSGAIAVYSDPGDLLSNFGMSPLSRIPDALYAPEAAA